MPTDDYTLQGGNRTLRGPNFAADHDAEVREFVLTCETDNNTQTELFIDGDAGSQRIGLAASTTYYFHANCVARRTDADGESGGYRMHGLIDTDASTVVAFAGGYTGNAQDDFEDTGGWAFNCIADDTNDAITFHGTGENAKTIQWVCHVLIVSTTG